MAQAKRKQTTRVGRGKAAPTRRNSGVKDKYPGYVFLGSVKSDDPRGGDDLSRRLWQAGAKFYFSRNGGRVYVSPGSRDVARKVYKEFTGRKPNSFMASVVEGAGTGIGLGLAGAAALPMVRKAFPGLMRGKANPALPIHEDGEFWVTETAEDYVIYKIGPTASTKVATIGKSLGWTRVLQEIERRKALTRRNPADTADAMYESFHGVPATGYEEIIQEQAYHSNLAELGKLESIKFIPQYGTKKGHTLEVTFDVRDAEPVLLCSNESGTQLYIRGGDQEVDIKACGFGADKFQKDLMALGTCVEITYQTRKKFDRLKTISYFHQCSEVSKDTHPVLVYDTMNHELSLAGGSYKNLPAGITD